MKTETNFIQYFALLCLFTLRYTLLYYNIALNTITFTLVYYTTINKTIATWLR